jgi:iron complex transport system ATP-binding protein
MPTAILETRGLSVGYVGPRQSRLAIASGIDLRLHAGELVCLLGPNGAGKSTLLRTLAAMQEPLGGEVLLAGKNVRAISKTELARQLSVVLTERVAVGLLTAYEIVALGRSPYTNWSGALSDRDHAVVAESIRAVDAESLAHRYVSELSDGERQKVMLARALAQEPQLMILDEITAFLDLPRRVEIIRILRDLAHHRQRAILLSTHDLELALSTADRIWLMPKGEAIAAGTPEDLVLRGVFASAFASEGVRFDEESGSFATQGSFHSEIGLIGDDVSARWTRRALERQGYRVSTDSASCQDLVAVTSNDRGAEWEVSWRGQLRRYASIESLLAGLAEAPVEGRHSHNV